MTGKNGDVIEGRAQLSTGAVEAVLDLKNKRVIVTLDTDNDGRFDTRVIGQPASRLNNDNLSALLYDNAVRLADGGMFTEQDVRLIGIDARGIDSVKRGSSR